MTDGESSQVKDEPQAELSRIKIEHDEQPLPTKDEPHEADLALAQVQPDTKEPRSDSLQSEEIHAAAYNPSPEMKTPGRHIDVDDILRSMGV
jgi:hypothetical protein